MRPADERAGLGSGLPGKCTDWDHPTVPPTQRAPVMLVPPLTGSWLEKRLTSSIEPWFVCKDNAGWAQWWPPSLYSTNILPGYADCWANDATLRYDASNDKYQPPPGVEIRVNMTLDSMCNETESASISAYKCTCGLLERLGWRRHVDFQAAAYDWRMGPKTWTLPGGYFARLQGQIEAMRRASRKKVVLVGFSLGGPVGSIFLGQYVSVAWKAANIAGFVSLDGVMGGVPEAMAQQISPASMWVDSLPTLSAAFAEGLARSWGAVTWMTALLPPDDLLAQTLDASGTVARAYSRREAVELYTAAGANDAGFVGAALAAALKYDSRRAPGVRSWVIFGTGSPTLQTLIFPALKGCPPGNRGCVDWSGKPTAICIDGDGVGTNTSLQAPAAWAAQPAQLGLPVTMWPVAGMRHGQSVSDERAQRKLIQALVQASSG